jgi:hypothetical protein
MPQPHSPHNWFAKATFPAIALVAANIASIPQRILHSNSPAGPRTSNRNAFQTIQSAIPAVHRHAAIPKARATHLQRASVGIYKNLRTARGTSIEQPNQ